MQWKKHSFSNHPLSLINSYCDIDSWVQNYVSWVWTCITEKTQFLNQKNLAELSPLIFSYVSLSWASWVLKHYELGSAGLAGFEKIKVRFSWVFWIANLIHYTIETLIREFWNLKHTSWVWLGSWIWWFD